MLLRPQRTRPDVVAAWAVATGVGLIVLMLAWSLGSRATTIAWEPPIGPTVAFVGAILVGIVATVVAGIRLVRSGHR